MTPSGSYPGFRTPQGDGEILCLPGAAELPAIVARNRQRPELAKHEWFGRSLAEIATTAREAILADALFHTRQYADVDDPRDSTAPLIIAGHQPEFFHPGVWLKNFEAARLAKTCGGTAINLVIDSDLCRSPAIRIPTGSPTELRAEMVPFDQAAGEVPYEERRIADHDLWKSFGARVATAIKSLVAKPLIEDWWPTVVAAGDRGNNLGQALSQARHQLELDWGFQTLELPQSHVCRSEAFHMFALQLFLRAAEFRDAYNGALADYRTAHGIKNHAQPMPNLAASEGWIETPFWLWNPADPQRQGVFVRLLGNQLELSDRKSFTATLPTESALAMEMLIEWEAQGIKLRTRALATTLFARLLLADLFIHGIGGAKYDQVTDEICSRFFGFRLPAYATVSGTLRLPIDSPPERRSSIRELRQELRQQRFHPERFVNEMNIPSAQVSRVEQALAEKKSWLNQPKTKGNAAERHHAITAVNRNLQPYLKSRREIVEREIAAAKLAEANQRLRNSREYAYCLFPPRLLRAFFTS